MSHELADRVFTLSDIRALQPCYDPTRYLPEDWRGTIIDGLQLEHVPATDRIWVAIRLLDDRTNRLFAVWCAREALALIGNPDPRSVAACDVAERYANGLATRDELAAAGDVARAAAWTVAWVAARAAARDVAWVAARAAAWDIAGGAARAAARDVSGVAARAAARDVAWVAARTAARAAQIKKLISMIEDRHEA